MQDTRDRIRALDDRKRALLLERQELVVAAAILHGGNGGNYRTLLFSISMLCLVVWLVYVCVSFPLDVLPCKKMLLVLE